MSKQQPDRPDIVPAHPTPVENVHATPAENSQDSSPRKMKKDASPAQPQKTDSPPKTKPPKSKKDSPVKMKKEDTPSKVQEEDTKEDTPSKIQKDDTKEDTPSKVQKEDTKEDTPANTKKDSEPDAEPENNNAPPKSKKDSAHSSSSDREKMAVSAARSKAPSVTFAELRAFISSGRDTAVKAGVWFLLHECELPAARRGTLFIRDTPRNVPLWTAALKSGLTKALAAQLPVSEEPPPDEDSLSHRSSILDGYSKSVAFQTDGTIRKAYYTDLVNCGEPIREFCSTLSKLPVRVPGAYIPDLYDACQYLFTDRLPGQWQYQPYITSLIALTRFGFPTDATFHRRLLDKSVSLYLDDTRFPEADEAAGYPLLKLLWRFSGDALLVPADRTAYRRKLTDCLAARLEQVLLTAGRHMPLLRSRWETIERAAMPELSAYLPEHVFRDERLSIYAAQFASLSPSDTFFILSRYLHSLYTLPDGVSALTRDPRRIKFVCDGMRILTGDEMYLSDITREFQNAPETLSVLSPGTVAGLPDAQAERWWKMLIRMNRRGLRNLCETLCVQKGIRLLMIEQLLRVRVQMEFQEEYSRAGEPPDDGGLPGIVEAFLYAGSRLSGRTDRGKILFSAWMDGIINTRRYDEIPYLVDALDICMIPHMVQEKMFRQADAVLPVRPEQYAPAVVYEAMERWERQITDFTRPRILSRSAAMFRFYTRFTGIRKTDAGTLRRARELAANFSALRIRLDEALLHGRFYQDVTRKAAAFYDPVLHTHMIFLPNFDVPESIWDMIQDVQTDEEPFTPDSSAQTVNGKPVTAEYHPDGKSSPAQNHAEPQSKHDTESQSTESQSAHNTEPEVINDTESANDTDDENQMAGKTVPHTARQELAVRPTDVVTLEMDCLRSYAGRVLSQAPRREQIAALASLYAAGWIPWRTRENKRPGARVHETVYFISGKTQARLDGLKNILMSVLEDWIYNHYRPWMAGQVRRYQNRSIPEPALEDLASWLDEVGGQIEEQGFAILREYASGLAGRVKRIALFGYTKKIGLPEHPDEPLQDETVSPVPEAAQPVSDREISPETSAGISADTPETSAGTSQKISPEMSQNLSQEMSQRISPETPENLSPEQETLSGIPASDSEHAQPPENASMSMQNVPGQSSSVQNVPEQDVSATVPPSGMEDSSASGQNVSENAQSADTQSSSAGERTPKPGLAVHAAKFAERVRKAAGQVRETAKKIWKR